MAGRDAPYGFPARRRGWGWGVPAVWEGWAVLLERRAARSQKKFKKNRVLTLTP